MAVMITKKMLSLDIKILMKFTEEIKSDFLKAQKYNVTKGKRHSRRGAR